MEKKHGIGSDVNLIVINLFVVFLALSSCFQKEIEGSDRYVGVFNHNLNKTEVTLDLYSQYGTISMNETNSADSIIMVKKYFFRRKKDTISLADEFGNSLEPFLMKNVNAEQIAILSMPDSDNSLFGINKDEIVLSIEKLEK